MIAAILRTELRALLRDGRAVALVIGFLVLLAGAMGASLQHRQHVAREKALVTAATRSQWESQGDKHPHRGAHFGQYALRPDSALAAFDPGLEAYTGQALWLEPHRRNLSRFDPAADAFPATRLGELSPAFVLTALMPLLLIALGFASISRERESGTLRMLHGAGLSTRVLLAGKVLVLLMVATALLSLTLCAFAATAAWHSGMAAGDLVQRASWLFVASLGYAAVFALLTVVVSTWVHSSRLALLCLLAIWFAWVFVVPRVGAAVAAQVAPLPSTTQFWEAIHHDYTEGLPGDGPLDARVKAYEVQLLREHDATRFEDLPVGVNALRRLFRDDYANRVHAIHFDALWKQQERQQTVLRLVGLLSPTVAMRGLSMAFAGTDLAHQRHFEDAAERYRQAVNRQIDEWDVHRTRGVASYDATYAGDGLWRSVTPFRYGTPGAGFALASARGDLAVLALWLLLLTAAVMACARRSQP